MAMLSFENVNVAIEGAPVLRNVSFSVEAGASAALIGRNGAGKTTTVRTIMGFTKASGMVRLGGQDLGSIPPHRRPSLGIGYAPEDRRLFSAFTVEENIVLPGRVAKLSVEQIQVQILLVKFADCLFVMKIMHGLLISLAHFHQIRWKLARRRVSFSKIGFKITAMAAHCLA